jgi:Kdo2-lipid IVA lauroyltransferase/acyltransferase
MYKVSDAIAFALCSIVRYRRDVVLQNLQRVFPDKDRFWMRHAVKSYYRHLSLVFHQMLYLRSRPLHEVMKHITYQNPEVLHPHFESSGGVMVLAGHLGSWELLGQTLPVGTGCQVFGAARKQSDSFFNAQINSIRSRFGLVIVPSEGIYRTLLKNTHRNNIAYFIADQSPPRHEKYFKVDFLKQPTAVFQGPEIISKKLGMAVFFAEMTELDRRGYYDVTFHLLADNAGNLPPGELTDRYMKQLESTVTAHPTTWLWSHRRWKHDFSA